MNKIDKNFKTMMSNGLFKHASVLGSAIWFYLWCVARTTEEIVYDNDPTIRYGSVLGGMPVCSEESNHERELRTDFPDFTRWTLDEWRKKCVDANLIRTKRTPNGYIIEVINSVKFPNKKPTRREMWEKPKTSKKSDVGKIPNDF
jgi:hypothetical protein